LYEEEEWHADKGHMKKTANFENPRWRTTAILKIVKSPYLGKNRLILMQFGVLQQILNSMTVT